MTVSVTTIRRLTKAIVLSFVCIALTSVRADEGHTDPLLTGLGATTISGFVSSVTGGTPATFSKKPRITAKNVIGKYVYITAQLPKGTKQATLEGRVPGHTGWKPRMVQHLNGNTPLMMFWAVPAAANEQYRVTVQQPHLPGKLYRGRHTFKRLPAGFAPGLASRWADPRILPSSGALPPFYYNWPAPQLWVTNGNHIYLYNQYRGLEVIDFANPDDASLTSTLNYPGSFSQLRALDSTHLLLAGTDCSGNVSSSESQSIVIVDVSGTPSVAATLPINGSLVDTRQIGSILYVVSTMYVQNGDDWNPATAVNSYDISNPASPNAIGATTFPMNASFVQSSDQFIVIGDSNFDDQTNVAYIDISAHDGTLGQVQTLATTGQLYTSDNLNVAGNVLRTVSQSYSSDPITSDQSIQTTIETFSLGATATRLGSLILPTTTGISASPFDGTRLYVNTGSDPMYVIDLSDPTNPVVAGNYTLGGYATFIYPANNRLVTLSTSDYFQQSLRLWDVTDSANITELSSVTLSNSGGNWGYNGFTSPTLLPDQGLILVAANSSTNSGFQLIDWSADALKLRGIVNGGNPATVGYLNQRLFSAAPHTFVTIDPTDRDNPTITKQLTLSWPTDRVFVAGDYLIELGRATSDHPAPAVRITAASAPDQILNQLDLTNRTVLGATVVGNRLYLIQGDPSYYYETGWLWFFHGNSGHGPTMDATLTTIDISQLPTVSVTGQTQITTEYSGANMTAVSPVPGVIVWVGANEQNWFWPALSGATLPVVDPPVPPVISPGPIVLPGPIIPPGPVISPGPIVSPGPIFSPVPPVITPGPITSPLPPISLPLQPVTSPLQPITSPGVITSNSWTSSPGLIISGLPPIHSRTKRTTAQMRPEGVFSHLLPLGYNAPSISPNTGPIRNALWPCLWRSRGTHLLAINVSDDSAPALVSDLRIATNNGWFASGSVFTTNGLVYLSHAHQWFDGPVINGAGSTPQGLLRTINFSWTESDYLDVIDYNNPSAPIVRDAVPISGPLIGISRGGDLLYTTSQKGNGDNVIDALAYDGAQASLVASINVGGFWRGAAVISGETLFATHFDNNSSQTLSAWTLTDAGTFNQTASLPLSTWAFQVRDFGGLLALASGNGLQLVDCSDPSALTLLSTTSPAGCSSWVNLDGADGVAHRGVWVPLGEYGIFSVNAP